MCLNTPFPDAKITSGQLMNLSGQRQSPFLLIQGYMESCSHQSLINNIERQSANITQ
ncbi:hypothetical protein I79_005913 [Cricetulus griseus]|uniref:Uncharacterized protein n=1 Tax=Cricetulus griseus TaxID=10029 RepID=G3H6F6_CRIGR|nr:hypothetical protein I79_005913 [Cricetulus griseus]